MTSTAAFIAAGALYFITFAPVTDFLYGLQRNHVHNVMWASRGISVEVANTVLDHTMNVTFSPFEFVSSFLVSIVFAVAIGLAGAAYIARNEPIQTMVEY